MPEDEIFSFERCFNCNKKETISKGFSDIDMIEVELDDYLDHEEMFMPLCSECSEKWEKGELKDIEEKWKSEENKSEYNSSIGKQEEVSSSVRGKKKVKEDGTRKITSDKMEIIQFDSREKLRRFMDSNNPIVKLAKKEGSYYGDPCDQCDREFNVIISGGNVNYYLCFEHFNQLKEKFQL